jgi:osmotically-inducible protein OsmY
MTFEGGSVTKPTMRVLLPAMLLLSGAALQGCVAAAVGAGAAAGVAASQDRGIKGAANDTAIRAEINHYWLQKDEKLFTNCNLQIHEGRVLVTGAVKDADVRAEAIQLAWKAKGVREVINEIEVTNEARQGHQHRAQRQLRAPRGKSRSHEGRSAPLPRARGLT